LHLPGPEGDHTNKVGLLHVHYGKSPAGPEKNVSSLFALYALVSGPPGEIGRLVAMSSESDWKVIGVQGRAKSERE
jgi:hypothetical protein